MPPNWQFCIKKNIVLSAPCTGNDVIEVFLFATHSYIMQAIDPQGICVKGEYQWQIEFALKNPRNFRLPLFCSCYCVREYYKR